MTLVKIGGSLLDLADLSIRLTSLFTALESDRLALLAGGGGAADLVRDWDRRFGLTSESAHDLAIDSLSLTAGLLTRLLPESALVDCRRQADECVASKHVAVLNSRPILSEIEIRTGQQLPFGWDVTSDSIAAWIGRHWKCDRLVLVKSVDSPSTLEATTPKTAALDRAFVQIAVDGPPVYWCNLRDTPGNVVPVDFT